MGSDQRPTVCSLFTGAGGLDIGLELAGFRTTVAVECDADCVATLQANQAAIIPIVGQENRAFLEGTRIVQRNVEEVGPEELMPKSRRKPDVMIGGPPCQPFSSSGSMLSVADPRGQLFAEFVRMAGALRPRLILFENVRGLVTARGPKGEPGEALLMVKQAFEGIGYATRFALLNAADYGSPQRRVRCFMIGSRDIGVPQFPDPTHAESVEPGLFETAYPWVPLKAFLTAQPKPGPADVVRPTPRLAAQLERLAEGTGLRSAGAREATRPGGHWGYRQGTFIADPSLPARTVTASASQDWIRLPDGTLRRLTWRECAGLQGFPKRWQFVGGRASQFKQIGNAVPVVFGRVIGARLREALTAPCKEKPTSAPLPQEFHVAISYTKKEHHRNGESRARVLKLQQAGRVSRQAIKGVGSVESQGA